MRQTGVRRLRVALLIETSNAYARGLLRGIHAYSREHGGWSLYLREQRRGEPAPRTFPVVSGPRRTTGSDCAV